MDQPTAQSAVSDEADQAKRRCIALRHRILHSLPPSKLTSSAKSTLLRLLHGELRFLSGLPSPTAHISSNVGYFESIVGVLLHPAVNCASRLCKPVPSTSAHLDIVCTFGGSPAWFLVSDRNPTRISWTGSLRVRAERALLAARSVPVALKPSSVFIVFARGLPEDVALEIGGQICAFEVDPIVECVEFEDLEEGWVGVGSWGMEGSRWFEVKIDEGTHYCAETFPIEAKVSSREEVDMGNDVFGEFVSSFRPSGMEAVDLINLDTTALIAMVSGISNYAAEKLLRSPERDMRERFKGNYEFVMAQLSSEMEQPILGKLKVFVKGKRGIICESVFAEFRELISMFGGPNEKFRAEKLLKHLLVVPDNPSARISGLPTTRRIAKKTKLIFGTGDHWHAPTLTANMGFLRAASQTGLSLLAIEHKPRALTGN
ncbi:hypothetical protein AXF42_Ash014696 [Apostasia shenzhenica]|uniref:DUF1308 domain-containing protein n=1 Tax=Apostasia shenzhenica TaxID=1088818 RepID=A0A2I0AKD7_9ASPA|nr:hypothetical protein AXF42_Ash014696 [Apostasia shenzhenica]